jgi:hypothetical protein
MEWGEEGEEGPSLPFFYVWCRGEDNIMDAETTRTQNIILPALLFDTIHKVSGIRVGDKEALTA